MKVLKKHYEGLCVQVATEILGERAGASAMLEELLDDFARKFYAVNVVYEQLESRFRVSSLLEARKAQATRKLRVATIHCRADIVAETINEWLAKHAENEVVSINFTQLGSGLACVILHREK